MKKKRQSVIILVMTLLLGMQSVLVANAAIAGEEIENVLNVDASDAQTSYEPEALPVLIGEEVSDSVFEESGDFSAMGNVPTCTVKTKKEFMNKLHKYLNKRKTKFVIQFKGSYKKIYKNSVENMFQQAWNIDNKKTSNDFDYLHFNISKYGFQIPYYSKNYTRFVFQIKYRETATQLKKVNKKVKKVLKDLKLEGKTRIEKIQAIHDYIVSTFTYDTSYSNFTVYDGLVDKSHATVCQGYALLFYKMCTEAGIPCRYVYGQAGVNHAWNIVKIDGEWYHIDTTWDDGDSEATPILYDYFLLGMKNMGVDHEIDSYFTKKSFKKKYPFSKKDYTWDRDYYATIKESTPTPAEVIEETTEPTVTPQAAESMESMEVYDIEKESTEEFSVKEQLQTVISNTTGDFERDLYLQCITTNLRGQWRYEEQSERQRIVYDYFIQCLYDVVGAMNEEQYEQMSENVALINDLLMVVLEYWNVHISTRIDELLESDMYSNEVAQLILNDFTVAQLGELTVDEYEKLYESYDNKILKKCYEGVYYQVIDHMKATVITDYCTYASQLAAKV
ncbi:MAG: hypothetical protein II992_00580 [Lachnospiraceae bacterium]|nr:hypothetical protein [Lachnospiraceae bacterium]